MAKNVQTGWSISSNSCNFVPWLHGSGATRSLDVLLYWLVTTPFFCLYNWSHSCQRKKKTWSHCSGLGQLKQWLLVNHSKYRGPLKRKIKLLIIMKSTFGGYAFPSLILDWWLLFILFLPSNISFPCTLFQRPCQDASGASQARPEPRPTRWVEFTVVFG